TGVQTCALPIFEALQGVGAGAPGAGFRGHRDEHGEEGSQRHGADCRTTRRLGSAQVMSNEPLDRAERFCRRFGLHAPVLLAPMAGSCPPSLSIAVANAGGMGA